MSLCLNQLKLAVYAETQDDAAVSSSEESIWCKRSVHAAQLGIRVLDMLGPAAEGLPALPQDAPTLGEETVP